MAENYINIFSVFLAEMLRAGRLEVKDAVVLMKDFEPVCEDIKSRQDLIAFLDKYVQKYWELKELKQRLLDNNYHFA